MFLIFQFCGCLYMKHSISKMISMLEILKKKYHEKAAPFGRFDFCMFQKS